MRRYLQAIWRAFGEVGAALCGRSASEALTSDAGVASAAPASSPEFAKADSQPLSQLESNCIRAYFRLIGVIMRGKRWLKPGQDVSPDLRHALELFVAVEWQFAQCGYRPLLPLNIHFSLTEEPDEVIARGYVVQREADEEPVYFARAVLRRLERLAAAKQTKGLGA